MKIHPASPALYIVGIVTLIITLVGYLLNSLWFDPIISLIVFYICNEGSKFVAELTMEE